MYVLIFMQLVSEAFLTQEEFKRGVVNELSLSCIVSVIFSDFEFGPQILEKALNVIFHENPHCENLVVHADRLDEASSPFSE
jgi:hypothetical protein